MADQVVRALEYRVVWAPDVDYKNAPSVKEETDDFMLSLSGQRLRIELKSARSSIEEVRGCVKDYLDAWMILIGLQHGPDDARFVFERAGVEEAEVGLRDVKQAKRGRVHIEISSSLSATPHVSYGFYPPPPKGFVAGPDVRVMFLRYEGYLAGKETLLSMANFCLRVLEHSAGGKRAKAAKKYSISVRVLRRLGDICANKGSETEARKAPLQLAFSPLTQAEKNWVTEVVKAMIRRAGEVAASPNKSHPRLTMADFP